MTYADRELQIDLIEFASARSDDPVAATAALMAAAAALLSECIGKRNAATVIHATVRDVVIGNAH